jgi:hypothetical protein
MIEKIKIGDLIVYDDNNEFHGKVHGLGYVTEVWFNKKIDRNHIIVKWISVGGYPHNIYDWREVWYDNDFNGVGYNGKLSCVQ